jgi:hypothetical protein
MSMIMLGCMLLSTPAITTGCKTPAQTVAYNSLRGVAVTVDNAMRAYADTVVAGRVSDADQQKIRSAYENYQHAMVVAVTASRLDYASPAPADLSAIATELINLIKGLL